MTLVALLFASGGCHDDGFGAVANSSEGDSGVDDDDPRNAALDACGESECFYLDECFRNAEPQPGATCLYCNGETQQWEGAAQGISMAAGSVYLPVSWVHGTPLETTFEASFDARPAVFASTGSEGADRVAFQVTSVTQESFGLAQAEPPGSNGPHRATRSSYFALPYGTHSIGDGVQVEVIEVTLSDGEPVVVPLSAGFTTPPVVLSQRQTLNSESRGIGQVSTPWLVSTVDEVTTSSLRVRLDRAAAPVGDIEPETVAVLAITAGNHSFLAERGGDSRPIELRAETVEGVRGWFRDFNNPVPECDVFPWLADDGSPRHDEPPLAFMSMTSRKGADGGWARQCSLGRGSIGVAIDEASDNRVHGAAERVGVVTISEPFDAQRLCVDLKMPEQTRIWASGCPHVGSDWSFPPSWGEANRESLAEPLRQSGDVDGLGFAWDAFLLLGDLTGYYHPRPPGAVKTDPFPPDDEGAFFQQQLQAVSAAGKSRGDVFTLIGNHDAAEQEGPGGLGHQMEPDWWFHHWIDPLNTGNNTHPDYRAATNRRFEIRPGGTFARYSFDVGNIRFLMIGDSNTGDRNLGGRGETEVTIDGEQRITSARVNGHPAGKISEEAFRWLQSELNATPESMVVIVAHHHMLQNTTSGSGVFEGNPYGSLRTHPLGPVNYHGRHQVDGDDGVTNNGTQMPEEAISEELLEHLLAYNFAGGFIYFVGDTQGTVDGLDLLGLSSHGGGAYRIQEVVNDADGKLAVWLGAHTHLMHPLDPGPVCGPGETPNVDPCTSTVRAPVVIQPDDYPHTSFVNVGSLTEWHSGRPGDSHPASSRVLVFTEGRDEVEVRTYLHTDLLYHRTVERDHHGTAGRFYPATWQLPLGERFHGQP